MRFAPLVSSFELALKLLRLSSATFQVESWQTLTHETWFLHKPVHKCRVTNSPKTGPDADATGCLKSGPSQVSGANLALGGQLDGDLLSHRFKLPHFYRTVWEPA